jgi:hypothetical protein
MPIRLKQLRTSRTQLRCTRVGPRVLIYPKGLQEQAVFDFVKWCAVEPGYTVVAVHAPRKTSPEALEDVVEDLAACPGVLRLIPARSGSDTTLEFGNWLARRLGRTVVAHQGSVMIVPGGGLYVPPGERGGAGWLRFEPGNAAVAHSRRFPRPGWDCEPFAEPHPLGPDATAEPLPAGVWIRSAGDSPDVDAFRSWLLGGMSPDPLLPRVVLGYPGSPAPPIEAVADFWRSLPGALRPAVRFAGFGGTDEGPGSYGQQLADALDAPVVLGNGVQLAGPSANGGNEMRSVLRQGVMSWPPYVWDLGYLPARSTGGVPADPVAIGHRAPILGLREREPGVYEYGHDVVLEVTQSGLWVRPPALPADSFNVRTERADPAHAVVVFDASTRASAHRMQLLATEMVQRLEPRVRTTARILASSSTGSVLHEQAGAQLAVLDRPQQTAAAPAAFQAPAGNGVGSGESALNLAALTGDAARTPLSRRSGGIDPADLAAGATLHIPIETLLANLTAGAGGGGSGPANGDPAYGSSWLEDFDDAPVPPAVALYALAWDPDAEAAEPGADLVSRTVAEARGAQAARPAAEDVLPGSADVVVEAGPALGTVDATDARPALVSDSAVVADPVVTDSGPVAELEPVVITGSPATLAPIAPAPSMVSEPAAADAPPTQLASGPLDAAPAQLTQVPAEAGPVEPASGPVAAEQVQPTADPAANFTVARRRQRKGRATPAAQTPDAPTTAASPIPAEFLPNAAPAPSSTPAPQPAKEPGPEPESESESESEPDEPIQYGTFQLVSSSADLSFDAPSAPAAPAPEKPRPVALPTPAAPTAPPPPAPTPQPADPQPVPVRQRPAATPVPETPAQPQPQPTVEAPPAPAPASAAKPATAAPASAKRRPAKSAVRVQPVPTAQCSVLPREGGLAKERDWLRRNLSKQYDATASSVARILSEYPGLRAGSSASDMDVLTDLVALRLYLTGKIGGLDDAVRAAQMGPHVPLARCAAAGLRRLPSYRGPLRTRVTLNGDQIRWYGNRPLITEWSFLPTVASPKLDLPGNAQILIWSMSARRTGLLDPSRPDQVVFEPGTSFKILSAGTGKDDGPEIRLRELTRTEVAPDGTVQSMPGLDEFAVAALEEVGKAWRQEDPVERLPADRKDWFASPPGLLAPAASAGSAGAAKESGKGKP